ncbi:MAG: flagellar filament capping protein FliD [Candidatus Riflebacteria bacterium]|nr:flagellar filament capping protein FliD [Candidatus Riflebacteria bacterium]
MVSSISRNWVGGLSSGLDTQSLIDQMMKAESYSKYSLQRKRTTMDYQRTMLQEVNLKLFELQNKATDLTFSRTFNSKKIDASDPRTVNASATTDAAIGSYTMHVKQIATATTVSSQGKLAGALELGYNLASTKPLGGSSTSLDALDITPGNLEVRIVGGGSGTYNISTGATGTTSVQEMITNINASINNKPELKNKLNASYDARNNSIRFNLLDQSLTVEVADVASDGVIAKMFDADGQIDLNKDLPGMESGLKDIRSGLETTLGDLGMTLATLGTFTIERAGTGIPEAFDISGLALGTSVEELIKSLNSQIDGKDSLIKGGAATGNPADRLVEFRYDQGSGKLQMVNTNSADTNFFSVEEASSGIVDKLFGGILKVSSLDKGEKLSSETFAQSISAGIFTVDGVQISINPATDDLQGVLSRITAMTNLNATYDSKSDVISLTRKDGSTAPIGIGSSNDTSNFLGVTGLIAGSQASAANLSSSSGLGLTFADSRANDITTEFGVAAGTLKILVNGQASDISYGVGETLSDIVDKIAAISGVDKAYYDATTGKVNISTKEKGTDVSLEIQDVGVGTLGSALGLASGPVNGLDTGSSIVSARPISDVKTASPLASAGFASPVTAGSFSINGVKFSINSTSSMTLDQITSAINNNTQVGVKAHYDKTNGKFVLTSTETGNRAIALGSSSDSSNFLSAMGLSSASQNVGSNAIYSIDGVFGGADQVSQDNSISDVVNGVTFNLYDATDASGVVVNVEADTEVASKAIADFLESYNEVTEIVFSKLNEGRNWELQALTDDEKSALSESDLAGYEEAFKVGLLSGDNTLRSVRSQMRLTMSSIVPGIDKLFDSLSDIGITTGVVGSSYKDTMTGTLQISSQEALDAALKANPDKIAALFNQDSTDRNKMGIARRLKDVLNEYTKSDGLLTKRAGRSGVASSNSEMDKQISLINTQIATQEERLRTREEALLKQFSTLETAMANYQSQSSAFASQLSQLSGS